MVVVSAESNEATSIGNVLLVHEPVCVRFCYSYILSSLSMVQNLEGEVVESV